MGHDVPRALHGMRSVMTCGVSCAACVIPTWSVTVSCHAAQAITYEPVRCQPKVHSVSESLDSVTGLEQPGDHDMTENVNMYR